MIDAFWDFSRMTGKPDILLIVEDLLALGKV